MPTSLKDLLIDFCNKIIFFIYKIWFWFREYLSYILNKILEILKNPSDYKKEGEEILPDPNIYKDIYNKEYINNVLQNLDDYKFYILISIVVIAIGLLTYTYWDSFSNLRRGGSGGDTPDIIYPSPIPSDPSTDKSIGDYPEGYLN